ncbi:MAG: valine--tRNA ligase [Candidatus Cloacimonetes bacterium]|nr:valine--tRNA ligase [Candidatus Cloacimonadota bacterium]MBS3767327.1 valine--tRNA ligase [Candidatus Cloacimonadota bacterium]
MNKMKKVYNPQNIESRLYKFWQDLGIFKAEINENKEPFTIVIPPPNVTGILHMGHILNNTLQDIMIRYKKMQGFETLWLPGTDHAGIATQNVVEKELAKEGKTRFDLGREKMIERIWEWKDENGNLIIDQLKKLGSGCDWSRERFTMDEGLSNAVKEVFIRLYEKNMIYKGKYIINWCPRCETALADDEVEHEDKNSKLWYIKYPFKNDKNKFVEVATTRPETMLGDTAVAVNPSDERFKDLIDEKVIVPLVNREIEIIADDFVDSEFGTGCVKVTPAHDENDFEIGRRNNLKKILIMDEKGIMNSNAGDKYEGMDRFECRKEVLKDLEELGLLSKIEDYTNRVGHCYRCDTVIEPYLSNQWFVRMKPLAEKALEVVKNGKIKFQTPRWKKVYINWLENIHDWCISRQIWWGHRIPVYYCDDCGETFVAKEKPKTCSKCGSDSITQDSDVLDTWFSSWLWPFSTMGWPENTPDLEYFYPTDVLITDPGIIFFWVARMVMAGMEFMEEIPFKNVYIHGTVLDENKVKMSKSLGNSPDPIEIINKFGADAVRFSMVFNTPKGNNVVYSDSLIETGRNFANKIWNAARFVFMNAEELDEIPKLADLELELVDEWILHRLNEVSKEISTAYNEYRFNDSTHIIYDFFWNEFCAWYLEIVKDRIYNQENESLKKTGNFLILHVLDQSLRMLQPVMPFITEEIWQRLQEFYPKPLADSILKTSFHAYDKDKKFSISARKMSLLIDTIIGIRGMRKDMNVPPATHVNIHIKSIKDFDRHTLQDNSKYIQLMANVDKIYIGDDVVKPDKSTASVIKSIEIFMPLEGVIDIETERKRLIKKLNKLENVFAGCKRKLENEQFLQKAPAAVVEKEKEKKLELSSTIEKLKANISFLE